MYSIRICDDYTIQVPDDINLDTNHNMLIQTLHRHISFDKWRHPVVVTAILLVLNKERIPCYLEEFRETAIVSSPYRLMKQWKNAWMCFV